MNGPPFWGKYRGFVTDAADPYRQGRIKARVDDVLGEQESGWALPCVAGGSQTGFFVVPEVGAGVWIEFERGDPDHPVWTGSWRAKPTDYPTVLGTQPEQSLMLVTQAGHQLLLDDTPGTGGITLKASGGQQITINDQGVEITDGKGSKVTLASSGITIDNKGAKVELQSPKVSVNNGALEVK